MDLRKAWAVCGLFCAILLSIAAMSRVGLAAETVTGQGSASVEVIPTKAWMGMTLTGQGASMAAALDDLNARFRDAAAKLESLGAENRAIRLGVPVVVAEPNAVGPITPTAVWSSGPVAVPAPSVYAPPTASGFYPSPEVVGPAVSAPGTKPVKLHRVSASLIAGWKLPEGGPQKVLLFVTELTEKLEAADLFGEKNAAARKEKLSPEEQEIFEEMQEQGPPPYTGGPVMMNQVQPSRFVFSYVGEVTAKQRREALREAFEQAHRNALDLAEAAGVRLGPLGSLYEGQRHVVYNNAYANPIMGTEVMLRQELQKLLQKHKPNETDQHTVVTGSTVGELACRVEVNATFKIRQ